ncbi:MAG TPA: hypothetical protein VLX85_02645 [Stellaceae bacterium]|nr:hypothetical protein [Stellaceae bacterium]
MTDPYVNLIAEYTSDAKKADGKYKDGALKAMTAAAVRVLGGRDGAGFQTKNKGPGFAFRLKVEEITLDQKTTKCVVSGAIAGFPKAFMVSIGPNPTATATVQGGGDRAIADCIDAASDDLVSRKLIPGARARYKAHGTDP